VYSSTKASMVVFNDPNSIARNKSVHVPHKRLNRISQATHV
jgi:hypothetical protein